MSERAAAQGSERVPGLGTAALVVGVLLLALALLYDEARVASLRAPEPLGPSARHELAASRVQVAALGALFSAAGARLAWRRPRWARRRAVLRAASLLGLTLLPLFLLERGLRPLVERTTRIFMPDEELGWRLVPGVRGQWLGVPVTINSAGMRGPERSVPKPAGTRRVLFLGDSVIFGAFIADERATIPAQVEALLDAVLPARIECLNAGVGGYSPWQEFALLQREAPRFEPDLVVLGFVLNDVTEKFDLERFGGDTPGFQLTLRRESGLVGWLASTAIVQYARRRGALRREALSVYELLLEPNDERVQRAWKRCMESLDRIVAWCSERELPLLFVVFPYTVQLEYPELNAPQWILGRFCDRRDVPFLDLLPPLCEHLRSPELGEADLFVDAVHPNERGCALLAELIAARILEARLLPEE